MNKFLSRALAGAACTFLLSTPALCAPAAADADSAQGGFAFVINGKLPMGTYEWYYNPSGAPAAIHTADFLAAAQEAAQRWADVCNVEIVYKGLTNKAPGVNDSTNVIGWSLYSSLPYNDKIGSPIDGNLSVTNHQRTSTGIYTDTDTTFYIEHPENVNPNWGLIKNELTRVFGYSIGVSSSYDPDAVMYHPDQKFPSTDPDRLVLRRDDVEGCVSVYGASPNSKVNRVLNWGDAILKPGGIGPAGQTTQNAGGFNYRYYPQGDAFTGEQDGTFYVLFPGGSISPVGTMDQLWPQVQRAGY